MRSDKDRDRTSSGPLQFPINVSMLGMKVSCMSHLRNKYLCMVDDRKFDDNKKRSL